MNVLGVFNWLDAILVVLLCVGLAIGYSQGLLRQVMGLAALYIGAILGAQYFSLVANGIRLVFYSIPGRFVNGLAFFIILVSVTTLVNWLARDAYQSTKMSVFPAFDHLSGSIAGLITTFTAISLCLPVFIFATAEVWPWAEQTRLDIVTELNTSRMLVVFDSLKPTLLNTLGPWLPGGLPSIFNI